MSRLLKKMFRDIWQMKVQFFSIFVMCLLGILIYSGIEGVWYGMELEEKDYFKNTNLCDIWVNGIDLGQNELNKISSLNDVKECQLSAVMNGYFDEENEISVKLISNKSNVVSTPVVVKGEEYDESAAGIWLDSEYAKEKNVNIDDVISIFYSNKKIEVRVKGLVYSPEYISFTGSASAMLPDHGKYTYGFVSNQTQKELNEQIAYNQIKLITRDKCNKAKLKANIRASLEQKYVSSIEQSEWSSVSNYINKIAQIKKMSIMFSAAFFFLSILTIQTTMKRIVRKQRTQIGILKALGFYDYQIKTHYAMYGLVISLLGVSIGRIVAPYTVTPVLLDLQKQFYSMPKWNAKNSYMSIILAILLVTVCTITAIISCQEAVKELPANVLRDEAPSSGKRLLLERLEVWWNSLDFDWRWSVRDMFQNKMRTLIGIVGVLGSMVLLIASFGLQDTINEVNNDVYGEQYTYHEKMDIKGALSEDNIDYINSTLENAVQWISENSFEIRSGTMQKTENVLICDEGLYFTLYDKNKNIYDLPDRGALVTENVAKEMGIDKNSIIQIHTLYGEYKIKVDKIININSPQAIFISKKAWEKVGAKFVPTAVLAGDNLNIDNVENMDEIGEIYLLDDQLSDANQVLNSVKMIIVMLLAAAIMLSVVILYNLGILSYAERSREYATLRVLGFYNFEIRKLILKDGLINVIIGWCVGVPAGLAFLGLYVQAVSTSTITYSPFLTRTSFVIATVIAVGCSILVNVIVSLKVSKIDMVQSLKSVE